MGFARTHAHAMILLILSQHTRTGADIMKPDTEKYLAMIDDWDMTREQKIQYIFDLWHIMESFVDRAFGKHPVQQARDKSSQAHGQDSTKPLESTHPIQNKIDPPPPQGVRP
jgi:hypothetical protein